MGGEKRKLEPSSTSGEFIVESVVGRKFVQAPSRPRRLDDLFGCPDPAVFPEPSPASGQSGVPHQVEGL
jgi:hypothetical protein